MKSLLILLLAMFIDASLAPAYAGAEEPVVLPDEFMGNTTAGGYTPAILGPKYIGGTKQDVSPASSCKSCQNAATFTLPKGVQGSIWTGGGKASTSRSK